MKSTRQLLSLAALSAGLIIAGGARAEDWKVAGTFGWLGVGKVFQIEKGHIYWVGEFRRQLRKRQGQGESARSDRLEMPWV
jgi:hypothetical protein